MTGHGDIPIAVRALKAGASDFIEKPFADEVRLEAVHRALAKATRDCHQSADAAETRARHEELTDRDRDVFQTMIAGHPNKVIAHLLGISQRSVEIHRARVIEKMHAPSLFEPGTDGNRRGLSKPV